MTTDKYLILADHAETLCNEYVECVRVIEEYTTDMIMSQANTDCEAYISNARRLHNAYQRRDTVLEKLALLKSVAGYFLSTTEFVRYMHYVNVMISPLNA